MKNLKLKAARKQSCKTQAQVAKEIGIAEIAYRTYERGTRTPNVLTAIKIADTLGVKDLRELWRDTAETL